MGHATKFLLALSVVLAALGLASVVLGLTVARSVYERQAQAFAQTYDPAAGQKSHAQLFERARELHARLVDEKIKRMSFNGGLALAAALVLLCWTLDRRRLLRRWTR
ncbi:MAG: hypothetical protein ACLF0G_15145 [Candidatus Brocadiia bacterium]